MTDEARAMFNIAIWAIEHWGHHKGFCSTGQPPFSAEGPCDCGLDAQIKKLRAYELAPSDHAIQARVGHLASGDVQPAEREAGMSARQCTAIFGAVSGEPLLCERRPLHHGPHSARRGQVLWKDVEMIDVGPDHDAFLDNLAYRISLAVHGGITDVEGRLVLGDDDSMRLGVVRTYIQTLRGIA